MEREGEGRGKGREGERKGEGERNKNLLQIGLVTGLQSMASGSAMNSRYGVVKNFLYQITAQ